MKHKVRLKGKFSLREKDVVEFHPWIKPLLEEIVKRGWKYEISGVKAEVLVELDLDNIPMTLRYYPPRIEEPEDEGTYEVSAELGKEPPAVLDIRSIEGFDIAISTEHCWRAVEIDPFKQEVKWIHDVLWHGLKEDGPKKLAEAREVYEVAKWLVDERGFRLASEHVARNYRRLLDLFEKPYRFTLTLEVTVKDENKVPGWKELRKDLHSFFHERGLIAEVKEDRNFLDFFRNRCHRFMKKLTGIPEHSQNCFTAKLNILPTISRRTACKLCGGCRAVKGAGFRVQWRRPSWVRIPPPALFL